jgi:hypothetical protein
VDVQALDLLDQEQDCSSRRCDLHARIMLEAARPLAEDVEFLGVNPGAGHASTLLLCSSVSACDQTSVGAQSYD